ncbi:MAG: ABC transporter, partial [Clostridiales bacterium]|nr:ABC transporter [Clostridiales bacterium]
MNAYIADVQKDTMASYPITISSETIDVSSAMGMRGEIVGERRSEDKTESENRNGVFADYRDIETSEKISSNIVENNLTEFKKYLDNPDSEIHQYIGENGIIYTYDVNFSVYSHDEDGKLIDSDSEIGNSVSLMAGNNGQSGILNRLKGSAVLGGGSSSSAAKFSELMAGSDGKAVSQVITDSYDVLYGTWPEEYNEIILVLNEKNGISAGTLYQLGLITQKQYESAVEKIENGGNADEIGFAYEDICSHTFYLVPACDHYMEKENGTFTYIEDTALNEEDLLKNAVELKITGVIRPKEDAADASISTAVAYTSKLTDYIIAHTDESAVIKAQEENSDINVLTGMKFESPNDEAKANDAKEYLSSLGISEKASFYKLMMYYASSNSETSNAETSQNEMTAGNMALDETTMAAALDRWLAGDPDQEVLLKVYDEYIAGATYEDNLKAFGKVSYNAPASISIYTDSFGNKDAIAACIEQYNEAATEDTRITYTDYVA